jgi:hypothetical protein
MGSAEASLQRQHRAMIAPSGSIASSAPPARPVGTVNDTASGAPFPRRWRKLEGSDPSAYEMVLKIQALQRRLISKTEEVVEKDMLIQVAAGWLLGGRLRVCAGTHTDVWLAG